MRISKNDEEILRFWLVRKAAFPAIGDMSPYYLCMDGTIPRKKLESEGYDLLGLITGSEGLLGVLT